MIGFPPALGDKVNVNGLDNLLHYDCVGENDNLDKIK